MKTYNLGKIEILRDPRSELKRIVPSSSAGKSNSGFTNIYGYNKNGISEALDNIGFRLLVFRNVSTFILFLKR